MKTKIAYVVCSTNDDVYFEQALVSAWSYKYYNPKGNTVLVCDQDTAETFALGIRKQYLELYDEVVVHTVDSNFSMMERSRIIKTNLRNIIEGDYLFVDTDTVICGELSYIDDFSINLGAVYDQHCLIKDNISGGKWQETEMKRLYSIDVTMENEFFNSGVMFVRDTKENRTFYKKWNENWFYGRNQLSYRRDQMPLFKTNIESGHLIQELSGSLNCQVMASIKYLHKADIVHFFNNFDGKDDSISPFLGEEIYRIVKTEGLTETIRSLILDCKSSFSSPSIPMTKEGVMLWRRFADNNKRALLNTHIFNGLMKLYLSHRKTFIRIDNLIDKIINLSKKRKTDNTR